MTIEQTSASQQSVLSQWKRPPTGYVKVDFGGPVFASGDIWGIGVVIRDVEGNFMADLAN